MKKRTFSCLLAILCPLLSLWAQSNTIRPLSVGDPVPEFAFPAMVHYPFTSARLSDFKDQLLILDLMATNCYSCVMHLNHLDSLQAAYKGRVTILPVTMEKAAKVQHFLEKTPYGKGCHFPFAANDTLLRKLFPHQLISHIVWIYKGRVKAITRPDYINSQNIDAFLGGQPLKLPVKQDLGKYDPASPLLVANPESLMPANQEAIRYYSAVTPFLNGFSFSVSTYLDTARQAYRFSLINTTILSLYQHALGIGNRFPAAYTRIEVGDSSRFFFNRKGYWSEWQQQAFFCYQSSTPIYLSDTARRQKMLTDIDFALGLQGRVEKRKTRCLVVRPDTSVHILPPKPTGSIVEIFGLSLLRQSKAGATPIFVEMGSDDQRYVPMPPDFEDVAAMNSLLQPYGIRVEEEYRELELLVISDAPTAAFR